MLSYEKRINSFSDWPDDYSNITKKLAVLGHYSIDTQSKTTMCFYCKNKHSNWSLEVEPFLEHFKNVGTNCVLYRLQYPKSRRQLANGIMMNEEKESLLLRKFIYVNIDDHDLFFCMVCGSMEKTHDCNKKIPKITENIDIEGSYFYIKYFSGCFLDEITSYLEIKSENDDSKCVESSNITLNKDQELIFNYLLTENKMKNGMVTLDKFIDGCTDKIYNDLEKKMKSIENSAIEGIYNESTIL